MLVMPWSIGHVSYAMVNWSSYSTNSTNQVVFSSCKPVGKYGSDGPQIILRLSGTRGLCKVRSNYFWPPATTFTQFRKSYARSETPFCSIFQWNILTNFWSVKCCLSFISMPGRRFHRCRRSTFRCCVYGITCCCINQSAWLLCNYFCTTFLSASFDVQPTQMYCSALIIMKS